MPPQSINPTTLEDAVQLIIPYLEDTRSSAHRAIYWEGWRGLAASAVLRAIANNPPPSLRKKFNKIIHVDCSRWKSRRELQRTIARELELPHRVMDVFDMQDEEDDFRGVDESFRAEIGSVGTEIFQALMGHRCLVVFHNGSNDMVNLSSFGIPPVEFFHTKVLWTFRGRLRLNPKITEKLNDSHPYFYGDLFGTLGWNYLLQIEAREIAGYIDFPAEAVVEQCCLYLGGNIIDYAWATHASNYWVCDGIIEGGQADKAWEVAAALHQQIRIEDYTSNALPYFGDNLMTPLKQWILAQQNHVVDGEFLGLDGCKDQRQEEEDRPAMLFFQSLWVLDICNTDWDLSSSQDTIIDQMATNIRETEFHQSYGTILDMRFFQTLVLQSNLDLCWKSTRFHLNLCIPCTDKVEEEESDKKMTDHGSSGQLIGLPRPKLLIPNNGSAYSDVYIETMTTGQDYNSSPQLKPSGYHVEIGEGISNISVESLQGMNAIMFVMNKAVSLHVHDNSSITTVIPENMIYVDGKILTWDDLQECYVVRCSNMHTVFVTNYARYCFEKIETFWAANLLMAHCIWSKGRMDFNEDTRSFAKLRTIHLYSCPRLTFVLPLSWAALGSYLPNLETLHIVNCGDLKDVLPVEPEFLTKISTDHRRDVLEFPKLKQIYLHELYKLQHICEAKMFAPRLETVRLRGCWGLRRLPAVGRGNRRRPVVECEKDWWENLEWDGLADGHHPILFEPHHSSYYKKPLPRVSVLR
ncbi:unnamed protein product [Alopecurus aequalis]